MKRENGSSINITSGDYQHHDSELSKLSRSTFNDDGTSRPMDSCSEDRLNYTTSLDDGDEDVEVAKIKLVRVWGFEDSTCMIIMLGDAGDELARMPVKVIDNEIRYYSPLKKIKKLLRYGEFPAIGSYVYREFNTRKIMKAIRKCLNEGTSELEVLKCYLSRGEIVLRRGLEIESLRFRQKVRVSKYIVDFRVLGRRNIFIDVVEDGRRDSQRVGELQDKMQKIIERGYLYYWILEGEMLSAAQEIVELIVGIASGRKVYPPGLLTVKRLKTDENSINTTIELRLRKEILPNGKRRIVDVYEVSRYMIMSMGSIRLPREVKKYARFSQDLCNLLGNNYFYSSDVAEYKKIYNRLIRFGKTRMTVKKFTSDQDKTHVEDGEQK